MRSKREYDESHVITALLVKKVYRQSPNVGQTGYLTGGPEEWEILSEVQEVAPPTGTLWAAEAGPRASTTRVSDSVTHSLRFLPVLHGQQLH